MDHDDIITAVARLEAVADRFETTVAKVDGHESRIAVLEDSRNSIGKAVALFLGPIVVGLVLYFLIGKGIK